MEMSENGKKFIESFEGLFLKAYKCQAGVWTIGYGTTTYPVGVSVNKGDTCTEKQADAWMQDELEDKGKKLDEMLSRVNFNPTQNEFDALLSFIYNLGEGMLDPARTIGTLIRSGNKKAVADSMLLYCKYKGIFGIMRTSKGLLNRRKAEQALFLKPDEKIS